MEQIEKYYKKYGSMVYKRCMEILKNEDRALDAMQDVFARLMTNKNRITFPSTYLYRASTNVCLNVLRKEKNNDASDIDSFMYRIASDEDLEGTFIVKEKLAGIFQGEKKSTRVIAFMRYIDKMNLSDIADEMEMSVSGIKKRLRKIREKCREMELENEQ